MADARLRTLFSEWKARMNVQYNSAEEEARRFANFVRHAEQWSALIQGGSVRDPPSLDAPNFNKFADLSEEEWAQRFRQSPLALSSRRRRRLPSGVSAQRLLQNVPPAPTSADWRSRAVTPVSDQGYCGSCWSFTTVEAIEGAWALVPNNTGFVPLSAQELISCDPNDNGCQGGNPESALDWLATNGVPLATAASYPFVSGLQGSTTPPCAISGKVIAPVSVTGWWAVPSNEPAMAAWLAAFGPVAVAVDASSTLWQTYSGGIMTGCTSANIDHTVLLVGYGTTASQEAYWIAKNSWGTGWGELGYVRLGRGSNECGITTEPVIATVEGGSLAPPPSQGGGSAVTYTCFGLGCYSSTALIAVVVAAALLACCVFYVLSRIFCKRQASQQPSAAAGVPVMLVAQPDGRGGFRSVVVPAGSGGGAYTAYLQPQPTGEAYAPYGSRPAVDPAAAADAEADAAFEAATYAAIVASAAEARQQQQHRLQSGRQPSASSNRAIQVAYGDGGGGDPTPVAAGLPPGTLTIATLPGMPPPYAPTAAAAVPSPGVRGTQPRAARAAAAGPPGQQQQQQLAEALVDYRADTPAMRALLASQRRALGLPLAPPPPAPQQQRPPQGPQAWDPEA